VDRLRSATPQLNVYTVPLAYNNTWRRSADELGVFTACLSTWNRNGDFSDDGPPAVPTLERRENAGGLWHSFKDIELRIRFPEPERTEPFVVSFWLSTPDEAAPNTLIRYSRSSWRS
jgi:hypothetical protein